MQENFYQLIKRASTVLPEDVVSAMKKAMAKEEEGSTAATVLGQLLENVKLAMKKGTPICQDTGYPIFYVEYDNSFRQRQLTKDIEAAMKQATKDCILRPNAVNPITGENSGDNSGVYYPFIHFKESEKKGLTAKLLLKGGGCENVSAQYKLPEAKLAAGRDLNGVARIVLDAVYQAQGQGCGPAIIGVGIGGDRLTGAQVAKEQLFRLLTDKNKDSQLAALEESLAEDCNQLDVGPMGFGGKTTVLGVKIGWAHRLPASYFVSIAYLCWAARRAFISVTEQGVCYE